MRKKLKRILWRAKNILQGDKKFILKQEKKGTKISNRQKKMKTDRHTTKRQQQTDKGNKMKQRKKMKR